MGWVMIKQFFDEARKIAGGTLTQSQVDKLNVVVDDLSPKTTQTTSTSGIDLICSFEGLELEAYDDGVGIWTIGYGTTVINGVKVKKGDTCTVEQAKSYMASDLKKFETAVNKVTVALTQNQFDALVSLTYNIGTGAFAGSTLLKKLNTGDYTGAAKEFPKWNKAGGKIMKGLVNRRLLECELFQK